MTSRGWWLVLLSGSLMVAANLLLRVGIDQCEQISHRLADLPKTMQCLMTEPAFVTGVLFYGIATVLWFQIVATEPLGTAYPILISITFVLVFLGASVLFNEPVTFLKVVGLAVIIFGIAIISY